MVEGTLIIFDLQVQRAARDLVSSAVQRNCTCATTRPQYSHSPRSPKAEYVFVQGGSGLAFLKSEVADFFHSVAQAVVGWLQGPVPSDNAVVPLQLVRWEGRVQREVKQFV